MVDIVGRRRWFFIFSAILTIPGLVLILLGPLTGGAVGLRFSIDYTGGTVWQIRFANPAVTPAQVEAVFAREGLDATATYIGEAGFIEIRTEEVGLLPPPPSPTPAPTLTPAPTGSPTAAPTAPAPTPTPVITAAPTEPPAGTPDPNATPAPSPEPTASPTPAPTATPVPSPSPSVAPTPTPSPSPPPGNTTLPTEGRMGELRFALERELGPIAEQASLSTVGAVVSSDLIGQAILLIVVGSLAILAWITYRFRDVKFGTSALVALVHDVLVVVGAFAILGTFIGLQVDGLFVTAMLTVIGFSVHDTIVVFDRVRENKARHAGEPFEMIVNHSLLQTLGRSITTSLTVVIVLVALLLFAGDAIGAFVFALLLGIVAGTYSSICVASPLLVAWYAYEDRKRARLGATRPHRRATT